MYSSIPVLAQSCVHKYFPSASLSGVFESILDQHKCVRGAISKICSIINDKQTPSSRSLKSLWEEDLSILLEDETWDTILKRIHSSSVSFRHRLIQC